MAVDHHHLILREIKKRSGKPTQHTFLDNYLGNSHPRFPISNPELRSIASEFMRNHADLSAKELAELVTNLIHAKSGTEKMMGGILLDYSKLPQRKFNPDVFDDWLEYLEGWAEIDILCTGKYSRTEIPGQWNAWKPLLKRFSKSKMVGKRRASLVLMCSPLRYTHNAAMGRFAFENIIRLSGERDVLITKAVSWLLRSMIKLYRSEVEAFIGEQQASLPAIAVRETRIKLSTGVKSGKKQA